MVAKPIVEVAFPDVGRLHCANTAITAMQPRLFLKDLEQVAHTIFGEADDGLCQQFASEVSIESTPGEFILTT